MLGGGVSFAVYLLQELEMLNVVEREHSTLVKVSRKKKKCFTTSCMTYEHLCTDTPAPHQLIMLHNYKLLGCHKQMHIVLYITHHAGKRLNFLLMI